ncbi:MarR family transcriptional regulator [Paeniglutamicibacter antarcticus]|uniref:MarR family transcriptional regulator n=1 Tax=Arthrobacter terrae TaxID=2935737 RepID=A0A931CQL6_9MICC|nr:MarR family transcriptional regulator [Arthrobacter terrae]MBG0739201.1 MarR family transcriptional regulator [Arthrobacter terrae]
MPDMNQWPSSRLLSTAARLVEHAWNERLASIGMTHAGIIALDVLAANGPMTQAQLASIVRVQAQTMGKTLSRLENHGHVHRVRSTHDRRSHLVSLSDEGRGLLDSAHRMEIGLLETAGLDQGELRSDLKTIIRSMSSTRQNLREMESRARLALADVQAG